LKASAVEVRPLTEEELPGIEQHMNLDWGNTAKHRNRLRQQQEGDAVYLVAWYDALPVGHVMLVWDGASERLPASKVQDCAHIEDLLVIPRLRSTGIGSRLLKHAGTSARGRNFARIGLGVSRDTPRARLLYERLGYQDSGIGEYTSTWEYTDQDGRKQRAEETCTYLIKRLFS
jgi:GNAT superfamily N-acetyltransferase